MRARALLLALWVSLTTGGCTLPRWPVEGPLISPFGVRFVGWRPGLHRGVDIRVPDGTEVKAMAGGRIRFAGVMSGYGNVIWLDHSGNVLSVYGHLSTLLVRTGGEVEGGQVIALSGHTGNASGPHLHFEVWRNGREVDPVAFLGGFPPGGG